MVVYIGDLKITSTSTERQKRSQNVAPVLVIISGSSLVFSRKIITSIGFYRCCAPGASAPVVVKVQSPIINRTTGEFLNRGLVMKLKGLLYGNPTQNGESLKLNFWPRGGL